MTSRPFRPPPPETAPVEGKFPELPPRDDMQNPMYLHRPSYMTALHRHFGSPETTLVLGETPVGWRHSQSRGLLRPDLIVAFDVDLDNIIARDGYSIEEQGKAPDFVLEVASKTTGNIDDTNKREGYAGYGVPEYWRFDPTGGRYHQARLAGDRLVEGVYVPIAINKVDDDRYWGRSAVLGLDLCWEYGWLRWYDPIAGRYLLTHDEEADGRIAERQARIAAESERDAERRARAAAEAQVREMEAQLRRLQDL